MTTRTCHIPVTLRVRGEWGEDDWSALEEALTRHYRRALRAAALPQAGATREMTPPREPFVPERSRPEGYLIPSYENGEPVTVPVTPAPPRRMVDLDANVFDQINRGNRAAADALRQLLASGADVRVSRQAHHELVSQPDIPRTATANRVLLEDLGIREGTPGTLGQRAGTYEMNVTRPRGGGTVVSPEDARVIAAARVRQAEVWSFDRAFRTNPRNIEQAFGVRVAPESALPLAGRDAVADYRVGRQLLGLPPVNISLSGVVTRPGGPGGGGSGTPPTGAVARVGTPDMRGLNVGGPSPRGVAIGGGVTLGLQVINALMNWLNDRMQQDRVTEALARLEPGLAQSRVDRPDQGILLILFFHQVEAHPDSLIRPGPNFSHIEQAQGRTRDEAEAAWRRVPSLRPGVGRRTREITRMAWIPPLAPAGISAVRPPFPAVATATFAQGRAVLQDVEWNGLNGFDDEGTSPLSVAPGTQPRFLILKLPGEIEWLSGRWRTLSIPVEERAAAMGGNVPVVDLDPWLPLANVVAAFVFPADDLTDALFATTRPTRQNYRQIRYVNFDKGRWVRPENIHVLSRP